MLYIWANAFEMACFFFLFLFLSTTTAYAQDCNSQRYLSEVFPDVTVTSSIQFGAADPYGIIGSQNLLLDFYAPSGDVLEKRPLIIYAFGGGFLIGTRFQPPIPQFCAHFARLGYVVAAIDYRIGFNTASTGSAERAVYRGVQDLRAAMRYLAQFSADLGIDTTNIFLTGSSAGCFSALHSTFMTDAQRPQGTYGILLEPNDMGCSNCSGNNYLNNREIRPKGIINNWGAILDTALISPTAFDNVPVISFHGTEDLIVPYNSGSPFSYPLFPVVQGSVPIHQRLNNLGITNQFVSLTGEGHEPWLLNAALLDTVYRHSAPFLYDIMRPQTSAITGDALVAVGTIHTYSVNGQLGSEFCWEVTNGTIVSQNLNTIDILWSNVGTGTLSVTEVSCIDVIGLEQVMEVEIVAPTSIAETATQPILLHPNPTNGMLHLNGIASDGATITLLINDLSGRTVFHRQVLSANGNAQLDVCTLGAGSYSLVIDADGVAQTVRFVKTD